MSSVVSLGIVPLRIRSSSGSSLCVFLFRNILNAYDLPNRDLLPTPLARIVAAMVAPATAAVVVGIVILIAAVGKKRSAMRVVHLGLHHGGAAEPLSRGAHTGTIRGLVGLVSVSPAFGLAVDGRGRDESRRSREREVEGHLGEMLVSRAEAACILWDTFFF